MTLNTRRLGTTIPLTLALGVLVAPVTAGDAAAVASTAAGTLRGRAAIAGARPAAPIAQATVRQTGRLTGRILDRSGAALPGITLVITGPALAEPRTVVTDAAGRFDLPGLPVGRVSVTCSAPGFVQWRQEGIDISGGDPVTLNVTMRRTGDVLAPAGPIGTVIVRPGTLPRPAPLPPTPGQQTTAGPPPGPVTPTSGEPPPVPAPPVVTPGPPAGTPAPPEVVPTPGPSPHALLDEIDRYLNQLDPGSIAFNAPDRMLAGEASEIRLLLSPQLSVAELEGQLQNLPGAVEGARIKIAPRMEALLSGQNFTISAITPTAQAVSRTETTEWRWDVSADSGGEHRLHLALNATIEGTSRTLRTFDRTIVVNVTVGRRVSDFARANWQWLWATVLVPVGGWIWKRRSRGAAPTVGAGH